MSTREFAPGEPDPDDSRRNAGEGDRPPGDRTAREAAESAGYPTYKKVGLIAGPVIALAVGLAPAPDGLDPTAWRTAAVGLLMAVWWITEAIPIAATALIPLAAFPLVGAGSIDEAARPYANPLIFLFLGGFLVALAMQRWDLHRRIALRTVRAIGTGPYRIVAGFMVAAAFLSMWVSNTATAMMMMPIGLSVIGLVEEAPESHDANFGPLLMLALAYACSVGGVGTLIGTPPNAILAGFFSESYGLEIGFAEWLLVGLPIVLAGLPIVFGTLRWLFPLEMETIPGGAELIETELGALGPISRPERRVAYVFAAVALLWITRPLLDDLVPGLSDAGIAMTGALALFLIPAGREAGAFLLNWKRAERLPWGVLLLFGGGLSLAGAVERTGLARWIGEGMAGAEALPVLGVIALVTATVVFLTELTSNTATTAAFMPVMASVALGIGQNPMLLAVPAALAASCAFMLPVATPPNAIVYGSEKLSIPQMARAGVWLNAAFIVLVTLGSYALVLLFQIGRAHV